MECVAYTTQAQHSTTHDNHCHFHSTAFISFAMRICYNSGLRFMQKGRNVNNPFETFKFIFNASWFVSNVNMVPGGGLLISDGMKCSVFFG